MNLDWLLNEARRDPANGRGALIDALIGDPDMLRAARDRLRHYAEMESAGRLEACAISRINREILSFALAAVNEMPEVPVGVPGE